MGFNPFLARRFTMGFNPSLARILPMGFNFVMARRFTIGFNPSLARILTMGFKVYKHVSVKTYDFSRWYLTCSQCSWTSALFARIFSSVIA